MAIEVAYYEHLHPLLVEDLRRNFSDEGELDVLDDIEEYDLYSLLLDGQEVLGFAAVRSGAARLMADICTRAGDDEIERTEALIDAVAQLTGDNPISVECWTRGPSSHSARRVSSRRGLPLQRRILRLERHLPTLAGSLPRVSGEIGRFDPREAEAVVEVNNAAFADHPDRFDFSVEKLFTAIDDTQKARDLLLVHDAGRLAGFIWTRPRRRNSIGELYVLAVHPDFQRRGLGAMLLDAGIRHLYDVHGSRTAMLYVDASETRLIEMYERHGFFDTGNDLVSFLV